MGLALISLEIVPHLHRPLKDRILPIRAQKAAFQGRATAWVKAWR